MSRKFYLVRMRVNGIKNISTEMTFDFYNKLLTNFDPDLYKIKAIYGENGTGKTAIMTALNIVKKIVLSREYLMQMETQTLLNEIINKKNKVFYLEVEFAFYIEDKVDVYRYYIELAYENDRYIIARESLDEIINYTRNKKFKNVFTVENGKIKSIVATDEYYKYIESATMNLLDTRSFPLEMILRRHENEWNASAIKLLLFFLSMNIYLDEEDMHETYLINKLIRKATESGTKIDAYISKQIFYIDSKGRDIVDKEDYSNYIKKVKSLERFIQLFKTDLTSISIDKKDDGDQYKCELIMNYKNYSVNKEFESTGIKKLVRMFDSLQNADAGGISFIDEMDSNLNDVYLCKLIEYFMYYGKGQLCFTTHNLDPMSVLKNNRNSIDFLTSENEVISWKITGNAAPDRYYRNGMIEHIPFNIEAEDFIGVFGE